MSSKKANSGSSQQHLQNSSTLIDCKLPHDLMVSILTRLPTLSLLRFKTISKPFNTLISTPNFITLHHLQSSNNHSLIISTTNNNDSHSLSLFNLDNPTQTLPKVYPFPEEYVRMELVGSINGIVCLFWRSFNPRIVLWNPAIKQWKLVRFCTKGLDTEFSARFYLGMGFDAEKGDFKIVMLVSKGMMPNNITFARVYSSKQDSWKEINLDFKFYIGYGYEINGGNVIVKGNPIWVVHGDEGLLEFDVKTESFKHFPLPNYTMATTRIVECNDSLVCLAVSYAEESYEIVGFSMYKYDELESSWSKKINIEPGIRVERQLQCSKRGDILAEGTNGKLFVIDHKSKAIRKLCIPGAKKRSYEAIPYTESLVRLRGMKPVMEPINNGDLAKNVKYNILRFISRTNVPFGEH